MNKIPVKISIKPNQCTFPLLYKHINSESKMLIELVPVVRLEVQASDENNKKTIGKARISLTRKNKIFRILPWLLVILLWLELHSESRQSRKM